VVRDRAPVRGLGRVRGRAPVRDTKAAATAVVADFAGAAAVAVAVAVAVVARRRPELGPWTWTARA
jgi:hypothetical protein